MLIVSGPALLIGVQMGILGGSLGVRGEEVALVRVGLALREGNLVLKDVDQGVDLRGVDALRGVAQRSAERTSGEVAASGVAARTALR